tara:strand:+ start:58948 stop:59190 length:243 start_codon:yes stop_codon:yes gene_type:complete
MDPLEFGIFATAKIIKEEFGDEEFANQVQSLAAVSSGYVPRDKITMSEDGKHCISGELKRDTLNNLKKTVDKIARRAKLK